LSAALATILKLMSKKPSAAGKGSDRRWGNERKIRDNYDSIDWKKKLAQTKSDKPLDQTPKT